MNIRAKEQITISFFRLKILDVTSLVTNATDMWATCIESDFDSTQTISAKVDQVKPISENDVYENVVDEHIIATKTQTAQDSDQIKDETIDRCSEDAGQNKRSRKYFNCLSKLLIVACVILAVAVVYLAVIKDSHEDSSASADLLAREFLASRVLGFMDHSSSPCEDMHQFSCGGWLREHRPPDGMGSLHSPFDEMDSKTTIVAKSLLEERQTESGESSTIKKAKGLYSSCMDTIQIEKTSDKSLRHILNKIGGWPLIQPSWSGNNFNLVATMKTIYTYTRPEQSPLFRIDPAPDYDAPFYNIIIEIAQSDLVIDLTSDARVELYTQYVQRIAGYMKVPTDDIDTAQIEEMIVFQQELEQSLHLYTNHTAMNNKMTLSEAHRKYSSRQGVVFNWQHFVQIITNGRVRKNAMINVATPEYFRNLKSLLAKSKPKTVANYVVWKFIEAHLGNLDVKYREAKMEYDGSWMGVSVRYKTCVDVTARHFPEVVDRMFVQHNFDPEAVTSAVSMETNIRKAFEQIVEDLDWVDGDTKEALKTKEEHMVSYFGYNPWIMNDFYLDRSYAHIKVSAEEDFSGNILEILRQENRLAMSFVNVNMAMLRQRLIATPTNGANVYCPSWLKCMPGRMSMSSAWASAFYAPQANMVHIPMGIMQLPLFSKHYPTSFKYGGLGMIIGHEITHGFDNIGQDFDKDGVLRKWLSDDYISRFDNRSECFVEQYNSFSSSFPTGPNDTQIHIFLNGSRTLSENIADNGGLKLAYRAYQATKSGGVEPPLPGSKLTGDQLFFIAFAQIWCTTANDDARLHKHLHGPHSPGRFRVLGTLQNSPEFSEAFHCPKHSPMNPSHKCRIW